MKIHLIGIGGIGISGLAKYLFFQGHEISGSDNSSGKTVKDLEKIGIKVWVPHQAKAITSDIDLIIYSAIIKPFNIEIQTAKKLGIKTLSRKEALPIILKDLKVFSICGAHGKSTTSAILSSILQTSSIIGAYNKIYNSNVNFVQGDDTLVFEADESDASFLNSNPYYSIVTNTEPEHMEYYNYDYDRFYQAYYDFLKMAKVRIINREDPFLAKFDLDAISLFPTKDIKNIQTILKNDEPFTKFQLKDFGEFEVWGFGKHIALDTSLAILTALDFGFSPNKIRQNLLEYRGIEKRFDILQKNDNFILIDDYGHHPTEIKVTLKSAFEYAKLLNIDEVIAIWQPHKYSRTIDNLEEFTKCFMGVSKLIILPVWEAGEEKVDIDFKTYFSKYNPIFTDKIITKNNQIQFNNHTISQGLVIGFGAGNITYQLRSFKML
jgi:UDP-N-acetylmuramate--alanine ligase